MTQTAMALETWEQKARRLALRLKELRAEGSMLDASDRRWDRLRPEIRRVKRVLDLHMGEVE